MHHAMTLEPQQIDLWVTQPNAINNQTLLKRYSELMSKSELIKQQRYLQSGHRHDALITRAFIRSILSKYTSIAAHELEFKTGPKGKPELIQSNNNLQFNISHSQNFITVAVTLGQDIGVDVEDTQRQLDFSNLAKRNFSESENTALGLISQDKQKQRFFDYWTVKESYIKACGEGLSVPLDQFSVMLLDHNVQNNHLPNVQLSFSKQRQDKTEDWNSWLLDGSQHHRIAISIHNKKRLNYKINYYKHTPLQEIVKINLPLNIQ